MDTDEQRLVSLDVPCDDEPFPSVEVVPHPEVFDALYLLIAPKGDFQYPKYLMCFSSMLAFKYEDESFSLPLPLSIQFPGGWDGWAYLWENSPWVREYREEFGELLDAYHYGNLNHYIIFGGDAVIQVLCSEYPQVEEVGGPRVIATYRI